MSNSPQAHEEIVAKGVLQNVIKFCLEKKLVVFVLAVLAVGWGFAAAPFDWEAGGLERSPVPVDAIPDIGENQQIVFTQWQGARPRTSKTRSPIP